MNVEPLVLLRIVFEAENAVDWRLDYDVLASCILVDCKVTDVRNIDIYLSRK